MLTDCQSIEENFPGLHYYELDLKAKEKQARHGKQLIYSHCSSVAPVPSRWRHFFRVIQENWGQERRSPAEGLLLQVWHKTADKFKVVKGRMSKREKVSKQHEEKFAMPYQPPVSIHRAAAAVSASFFAGDREGRKSCLFPPLSPLGTPELFSGSRQNLDTWQPCREERAPVQRSAAAAGAASSIPTADSSVLLLQAE